MKKEKRKLLKKILFIIFIIFIIYAIIVVFKFSILSKISKNYYESKELSNYYYCSKTDNISIKYWRKDNIHVTNIKKLEDENNIIFWKNSETGEILRIDEANKRYTKLNSNNVIIGELLPNSQSIFGEKDNLYKFLTALHPMCIITSGKFNETKCYNINYIIDGRIGTEKIDKNTGLLLYTNLYEGERTVEYSFNKVTDDNVKKPNIDKYMVY